MTENGSGGSSPGCISTADQSIVVPSSRGGVPVFSRPSAKPARSKEAESPIAGASPTRPAGQFFSPRWIRPRRKVPVVMTTAPAESFAAIAQADTGDAAVRDDQLVRLAFDHAEIGGFDDRGLHRGGIKLAVGLGARSADGRALAAVQHPELDAAGIGHPAHQAVQGIDLADQMAFAETADGGIAGHGADGRKTMGHQRRPRAHAGSRARGFAAGMAAADDDDVEWIWPAKSWRDFYRGVTKPGRKKLSRRHPVSRETAVPSRPRTCFT
mgnify:CR=1 FL=1